MTLGVGRRPPPQQGGENQPPDGGGSGGGVDNERLAKLMSALKARLGDPYSFTNHKYGPKGSGVSCSGLFYSARQDAGFSNPVWGTYGYQNWIGANGGKQWRAGESYPPGTVFVRTNISASIPTHMAMSVGDGKVIEALSNGGVQITKAPGWNLASGSTTVGGFPDIGTSTNQTFGEAAGDAAGGAVDAVGGAVGETVGNIAQGVAEGIAQGFLRLLKYIYGKVILQPLDFFAGFWWEFLKHFAGEFGGTWGAEETTEDGETTEPDGAEHGDPRLGRRVADGRLFSRRV